MILVTGVAGFIGYHTARAFLDRGEEVIGVDHLNNYYDVSLKEARLNLLCNGNHRTGFHFEKFNLADREGVFKLFEKYKIRRIVHLAAQAGVRYSLTHPHEYVDANLIAFVNILEGARNIQAEHLTYASSSSVYGANVRTPFSVQDAVDHPISLYAATKRANELLAHSYSHLYSLPTTGLRLFTVYGPWGRPDMALFQFVRAIMADQPINIFNEGKMRRDFTYIDDIVEGILRTNDRIAEPDSQFDRYHPNPSTSFSPWRLYNLGNGNPVELLYLIELIEDALGKKAIKNLLPLQPGDMLETHADPGDFPNILGPLPQTPLEVGVKEFVRWYKNYYTA